jgi:hypothetical protein
MIRPLGTSRARAVRFAVPVIAPLFFALSCSENLPNGPNTFSATIKIGVSHDTLVVGDSSVAQAVATDGDGHTIQSLSFTWTSADSTIVGFAAPAATPDGSNGRTRTLIGKRTGRAVVTIALPDPRFVTSNAPRTETVVVGGVRILSTHDSTLTAVNDTAVAIAAGLVRSNGALVTRASQGIRWIHLGSHTTVVGTGDTIRYIARSNGADTVIATHDFCLVSAKCADTAVVRVSQQLSMTLSAHAFLSWSFADSLGPVVTLADRRGNGLAGTSVRLIPATATDSLVVKVSPPFGTSNPATGVVAAPRLISIANGSARVGVFALAPDGISVLAVDSITDVVRQVARRVAVEPLRALVTTIDSIPIRPLARDARGAVILDATVSTSQSGIVLNGVWAGPNPIASGSTQGTIIPTLSGIALPSANPLAPQVPVVVDAAIISIGALDTVKAGATQKVVSVAVLDSNAVPAAGSFVRFRASLGVTPDSVPVNLGGVATVTWTPPDLAGPYTLTGVRGAQTALTTLADSLGRIVMRRSVVVIASDPDPTKSTAAINATTIAVNATATLTITVRDIFANVVKTATPAAFTTTVTRGALSGMACTLGICTATYTAPATVGTGADAISVKILGSEIVFSPLALTITP